MSQKHSKTYHDCQSATRRLQVHQGGTRSGKTMGISEWLIEMAYHNRKCAQSIVTVLRKTSPTCKATVMRDFIEILNGSNLYNVENHNRTESTYLLYNTLFEFIGLDDPQKVRGRKRNVLWMNEANEFSFEDFTQMSLRTSDIAILDYNPSDEFSWIYDKVIPRDDCQFFTSTYMDNPWLQESIRKEIEGLQGLDDNLWKVFGLGERGTSKGRVYTHWQECDATDAKGEMLYGLDFGYNVPSALVRIFEDVNNNAVYLDEMLYESHLTNSDLIERLKAIIIPRKATIYADAAEPDRIDEIWRAGFNIHPADKSVQDGILELKKRKVYMTRSSLNGWKEYRSYSYKQDKEGRYLDEPVKFQDHLLDAARYGIKSSVRRTGKIVMGG